MAVIFIFGLPGSGKTTFAEYVAKSRGALHLNSDIIRDKLGLRGQYDEASKKKVYEAVMEAVEEGITMGHEVIVDATFYLESLRAPFREIAIRKGCQYFWIEIQAVESVIRERVSKKRAYSEADFSVYQQIKEEFEPLKEPHLTMRSDIHTLIEMVQLANDYLP